MEEVERLAQARVEYEAARKKYDADHRLPDHFIVPFKLRLDIAIVDAVTATYGQSDQYQLVLTMLTPKERGELIFSGALARKANTSGSSGRTQGAA